MKIIFSGFSISDNYVNIGIDWIHIVLTNPSVPTPTPAPGCYYKQVECVKAPCPSILVCPTPTLAPGCYYKQVECVKAPCPSILVCPTPTLAPIPTKFPMPTPTPTCVPRSGIYCGGIQGTSCPTGDVCIYSNGTSRISYPDESGTCQVQQKTLEVRKYCPL